MFLRCHRCGRAVSSELPEGTRVVGWIDCPQCIDVQRMSPPIVIQHLDAVLKHSLEKALGEHQRANQAMLSTSQAAQLMGIVEKTLEKWRRRGKGPRYHRLGNRMVRYAQEDVEAWIASREGMEQSAPSP